MILKPDEYKTARRLICKLQLANFDSCEFCPLSDVDNCCEHTAKSEKVLLALFDRRPEKYGEAEKEECRSDAAAKHRVDMLIKGLRKVQDYCAGHKRGCRGCTLLNLWGGCKLGSCPADWDLDDVGDFSEGTSTSGKGGSKP